MDGKQIISVIVPTYNSVDYIAKTLNTVFNQTFKPFEVVVSDDGSEDNTRQVVLDIFKKNSDVETTLLKNEHVGPGENRNIAIAAAQGDWIAFLDSDDYWEEFKLEKVARSINMNPEIDLWCHCEIADFGHKKNKLLYHKNYDSKKDVFLNLYRQNCLSTSAVVVKKAFLIQSEGFDPKLPSAQDYDLWLRLSMIGCRVGFIEEILGIYNVRDGNISSKPMLRLECLLAIGKKYSSYLREKSQFWMVDRLRFKGKAFLGCGLMLMSQRRIIAGMFYVLVGMFMWPFQKEFYELFCRKVFADKEND